MKIINVVGARPNFIKIAPLMWEMKKYPGITPILLHTGQHYDSTMSDNFFNDLNIPEPHINLEVGSDPHARQTAKIMVRFEKVLLKEKPDMVVVVGDVNSTMACTITAKKLHIKVAHVEAGLRSRDMNMPEEINRIVTDALADYLFTTSRIATKNLLAEGISEDKIYYAGNIMIDTLMAYMNNASKLNTYKSFGLKKENYVLLTMHRPSNVDNKETLERLLGVISDISFKLPVIFPIHPRTRMRIKQFGLHKYIKEIDASEKIRHSWIRGSKGKMVDERVIYTCSPLGYKELLNLNMNSKFVITDSGGLQEETTVCGIPCLTIRENTERPETVSIGTNVVVGTDMDKIIKNANAILEGRFKKGKIPDLWDGKTAKRIVKALLSSHNNKV